MIKCLSSQEHRSRQYAAAKGYKVVKVFCDEVTGGGDFMNRKGMSALLDYLALHSDDHIIVIFDDLKRFARDTVFHFKLKQTLKFYNAVPECLNFKFEDTPEGEFVETIFAAQGQLERLQNRRQTLQKMKARIERGYASLVKRSWNLQKKAKNQPNRNALLRRCSNVRLFSSQTPINSG